MTQPVKYQGVDKESSGYKLLAAMGWQEGSGLGARQQGIKEHVKVKKKHDSTGVGAVEAITKARDWTAGMAAYDLVLAKMKSVGAANLPAPAPVKTNKKKRKQPEDPSESPVPAAVLHPATAQPTDKPQNKQKKKRKAGNPENAAAVNAAVITPAVKPSTASPPAATEVTTVQQPSEPKAEVTRARGRHVGRYHKTAAAKKAGAYSKSDLAAILGGDSFTAAAPISAATVTVSASSPDLQESSEDTTFDPSANVSGAAGQNSEGQSQEAAAPEEVAQEPQDGSLWWHGMFVKAGRMGNMASESQVVSKDKVNINGFSEQDQENLYNVTQAGKSAGKKGLGKSSQGKPIGGAKWEGTKTVLDEEEEQVDAAASNSDAEVQEAAQMQGNKANASTAKIKWKKLAKRALTAAGGKLKVKKLQKQLLQQAGVPEPQQALALKHLMAQVISSKQFTVDGSSVTLAAL